MITLNKINKFLEDFSRQHYQINSYFFGDITKNRQVDVQYPFLIANPSSVSTSENQTIYTIYIWVLDRFQNGFVNERDVYNDTALILQDLKAYFQNNTVVQLILDEVVTMDKVSDEVNSDLVGGWVGVFKFLVPFSDDLCTIPMEGNGIAYADDWRVISVGAGSSGTSGTSGISGSSGSSGSSGISGISGSNGTSGSSGISGSSGSSGAKGQDGISSSIFYYQARTTHQSGDPSSGHLLWNTVTQSAATQINISHLTDLNVTDIDIFLKILNINQTFYIQDRNNSDNYQLWKITGTPTKVGTTYWTIPVQFVGGTNYQFSNNQDLFIAIVAQAGSSGTSGISGSSGSSGISGINGSSGTSGISGSSGSSGISGTSGTSGLNGMVGDGFLINDFNYSYIQSVGKTKVLCDGKILVQGNWSDDNNTYNYFFRLNPDYTLDTSFQTLFDENIQNFEVLSNGKIIVVGDFPEYNGNNIPYIVALNEDGTEDVNLTASFPILSDVIYTIKEHPDGEFLIGGNFGEYLKKISSKGGGENVTFYNNFTLNNGVNSIITAIDCFEDGRIVIGGDFTDLNGNTCYRLAILNGDGTENLGIGGTGLNGIPYIIKIYQNNILIGGEFTEFNGPNAFRFALIDQNLELQNNSISFGDNIVYDIKVQCDGKILVGGTFNSALGNSNYRKLVRLNSNFTIDEFFTTNFNSNFGSGISTSNNGIFNINVDITNQIILSGLIEFDDEFLKLLLLYNYSQIACCNPCGECEVDGKSPYFKLRSKFDIDGYPAIHTQCITFNPSITNINSSNPNKITIVPLPIDRDCVIEKFYQITENDCVENNHVRFAIYTEDGEGYPNKLLYDLGEYTINVSNIDIHEILFNKFLKKGLYYFCYMTENNCDEVFFRAVSMQHCFPYFSDILSDGSLLNIGYLEQSNTYNTGFPQNLNNYTPVFSNEQPVIMYSIKELR